MIDESLIGSFRDVNVDMAELDDGYPVFSSMLMFWCAKLAVGLALMRTLMGVLLIQNITYIISIDIENKRPFTFL